MIEFYFICSLYPQYKLHISNYSFETTDVNDSKNHRLIRKGCVHYDTNVETSTANLEMHIRIPTRHLINNKLMYFMERTLYQYLY
jgi:hypothetical protein